MALKCGCYMLICRDQLVCARVPEAKMTVPRALVNLSTAVTTFNDISSQVDRGKNDCAHRRFPNLRMVVDGDISSYLTEAEMHIEFQNLCATCASIPCKLIFFVHFSYSQ